jgi:hypothetical protein
MPETQYSVVRLEGYTSRKAGHSSSWFDIRKYAKETKMRLHWMCGVLFAAAMVTPGSAQISVYIGTPPPAVVYEEPGPPPGSGFVWIEGYWAPEGHRYRWVRGHWERPPFEGAYWTHPHYDHYREGWVLHEGHWDREDHDNHHWKEHDRGRGHGDHDDDRGHEHHD